MDLTTILGIVTVGVSGAAVAVSAYVSRSTHRRELHKTGIDLMQWALAGVVQHPGTLAKDDPRLTILIALTQGKLLPKKMRSVVQQYTTKQAEPKTVELVSLAARKPTDPEVRKLDDGTDGGVG